MTSPQSMSAIALGSNMGDSLDTLQGAIATIKQTPGIHLERLSSWYTTAPVGGPVQPDYLNACATLTVQLSPTELLTALQAIENEFGRVRKERWGPRTLDLDVILFEDVIMDTPNLQIPHPRMTERAFVLVPLAEIAPDWVEPVSGKTVSQLMERVDCASVRRSP